MLMKYPTYHHFGRINYLHLSVLMIIGEPFASKLDIINAESITCCLTRGYSPPSPILPVLIFFLKLILEYSTI